MWEWASLYSFLKKNLLWALLLNYDQTYVMTDTGWGRKCLTSQFLFLQSFSREPVPSLKQYICAKRQSNLQAGAVNVTAENSWRKRASSCFTLLLSFVVLCFWFTEGIWDVIALLFRCVRVRVYVRVCVCAWCMKGTAEGVDVLVPRLCIGFTYSVQSAIGLPCPSYASK